MEEHTQLKKVLGNPDRLLGPPRHPRPGRRFRPRLGRQDGHPRLPLPALDRHRHQQVPRLEATLRQGQRTQRLGAARSLAHRRREGAHPQLRPPASARRLSPADLHDARCRRRSPAARPASTASSRPPDSWPGQSPNAHQERHRLRPAPAAPRALARRCQLPQHRRHLLLPLLRPRRLQPLHRPLGNPRENGGNRRGNHHPTRPRKLTPTPAPRIISDNGPQFIAKDFKEFIRIAGMTHVRTSPYYPQSNGKIERWHKTLKGECIRVQVPLSLDDARRIVADYVAHYNTVRLHSAIGYVTPKDKLDGRDQDIFAARDRKLAEARERRKQHAPGRSTSRPSSPLALARPAIDFAAVRAAVTMAAGPATARLPAAQQPRRPATRPLSLARLDRRHQPLLLRQPGRADLPLLQVRPLRQRPGPVGRTPTA